MLIRCEQVLLEGKLLPARLCIRDGRIAQVGESLSSTDETPLELKGLTLLPGLIDSHIHGYAGYDTMDGDESALCAMSRALLEGGVTAFLPTTMTAFPEDIRKALSAVAGLVGAKTGGARILGAFAEGPFISEEHRGAQPLAAISPVDRNLLEYMVQASQKTLRKIILAPELEGAAALCESCRAQNIIPALGHSSATYDEAAAALKAGATVAVHTFNGMRGLHHREPGILGAVMADDGCYAELIFDGIHVHPQSAKVLLKAKGSDKVVLISDCMRAGGMSDGEYMLGDTRCFVKDGIARTAEGNLAGSTLKLIDAVKNMVEKLNTPLPEAVKMASENPAKELGLFDRYGSIAPGKAADLIAIDADFQLRWVMVDGEVVLDRR